MRRKAFRLFFFFSVLLFITACSDNINNNINETNISIEEFTGKIYKRTVNGIEFEVSFNKQAYVLGDNIIVAVKAKNITGSEMKVWTNSSSLGKNGAIRIDTYIDGEKDYISNSLDFTDYEDGYESVLENKESIDNKVTFYTDTIVELTSEDYVEVCVYLDRIDENGEHVAISMIVPVDISLN